ncbi:MAG: hypothetical protein C0399_10035, partial [Syntrophus sp. (in: bacteria)]|nr:hypothetical protein [Syntrophus sp. (in: bacteria)]
YKLYGTLSGGYYFNRSSEGEFSTQKIDEEAMWTSPGIRYEWNKDTSIETSYTYNRTRYNVSREDAERNLFQVRFRIECDLFN